LSLATPAALGAAGDSLHRQGVLVTRSDAIEGLAKATDVVFDKTGTLTDGQLELRDVQCFGDTPPDTAIALAAALETGSFHPVARAFRQAAPGVDAAAQQTRHVAGGGVEGRVDGQLLRLGTPDFVSSLVQQPLPAGLLPSTDDCTVVMLGNEHGWIARFALADRVRAESGRVVGWLRAAGLRVHLVSGDRAESVARVARELGIEHMVAAASPADKSAYVQRLQKAGAVVVMVGDGINDAAGLGAAQISVAMGGGAEVACGNSDVVLLGSRIEGLVRALRGARSALGIIRQNLFWAFGYNALAVPLAACGFITPLLAGIGMAASSALVIANALRLLRNASPTDLNPVNSTQPLLE
jgi:Cu2+-exporting ATPase